MKHATSQDYIKEENMHIKRDDDRKKHKVLDDDNEKKEGIRSIEDILGEDELVEDIRIRDVPNNGKRIDFRLSECGVRKLYDEAFQVAKRAGCSDPIADAYARHAIEVCVQAYAKGYIESKYKIKLEDCHVFSAFSTGDDTEEKSGM